jgi:hypothetical protein
MSGFDYFFVALCVIAIGKSIDLAGKRIAAAIRKEEFKP